MKNVKIIADSTCDLSQEQLETYDITVIPLYIQLDDKSYLDRLEITPPEIFRWSDKNGRTPKTAAPGIDVVQNILNKFNKEETDLIYLGISEDMSTTCNVVRLVAEEMGYDNLVISIKSSDVMMCAKAHELITNQTDHPLHVGITEAGTLYSGNIKSAVGLGIILYQGIGDTIRVSLTGDPLEEIKSAKRILKTLGLRKGGIEVVSCPTCGRTQIDLIGLANQVETLVQSYDLDIKVAVMGCVVNGPGEAKEADLGVAGGKGVGILIKKGEIVKKVPESELLSVLKDELDHWGK